MQLGYAFILPLVFDLESILDKYVVSRKVKDYKAFLVVVSIVHLLIVLFNLKKCCHMKL